MIGSDRGNGVGMIRGRGAWMQWCRYVGLAALAGAALLLSTGRSHGQLGIPLPDAEPDRWGTTLAVTLPLQLDPQPQVTFPADLPDTLELTVGQALDIPFSLQDPGMNPIGVQYLLDGEPLQVRRPFPVLEQGRTVQGSVRVTEPANGNSFAMVDAPMFIVRIPHDGYWGLWFDADWQDWGYDTMVRFYQWSEQTGVGLPAGYNYPVPAYYDIHLSAGEYLMVLMPGLGWEWEVAPELMPGKPPLWLSSSCSTCTEGAPYTFKLEPYYYGGYGYGDEEDPAPDWTEFDASTHFVRYLPVTHADRAQRYWESRHAYILGENDIGSHELVVQVQEMTSEGVRTLQARTFTLNVAPPGGCAAPTMEAVTGTGGRPIYVTPRGRAGWGHRVGYDDASPYLNVWTWLGDAFATDYQNLNFQPLTVRLDAPSGIASVEVLNDIPVPDDDWHHDYEEYPQVYAATSAENDGERALADYLWSNDGRYWTLRGEAAYRALRAAGRNSITLQLTSNCGSSSQIELPLEIVESPAPTVSVVGAGSGVQFMQTEAGALDVVVDAPGRDVLALAAVFYPKGWDPAENGVELYDGSGIVSSGYGDLRQLGMVIGAQEWWRPVYETYVGWPYYYVWAGTPANAIDRDSFRLRLPTSIFAPTGEYDLRFLIQQVDGRLTISDPVNAEVVGHPLPPLVMAWAPDYAVPPGESIPMWIWASKLGALDRLEVVTTDQHGEILASEEIDLDGAGEIDEEFWIQAPLGVSPGDVVTVTISAFDTAGQFSSTEVPIEIGQWGDRTVSVTGWSYLSDYERYAQVVVEPGGTLEIGTANVPLDRLIVRNGGVVRIRTWRDGRPLRLHTELRVEQGGRIEAVPESCCMTGGQHGGDSGAEASRRAYGDFREPIYPGAYGVGSSWYYSVNGGGAVHIEAPAMTIDGAISADGASIPTNVTQSYYLVAGAGGSVNLRTQHLRGNGTITANGGAVNTISQRAGAGGRIALHYASYGDGTQSPADLMTLQAFSGAGPVGDAQSGPGTIYLQRSQQSNGELRIVSGGRASTVAGTTLRSIGRHVISEVTPHQYVPGRYWIRVASASWPYPSDDPWTWQPGVRGLYVSLDADDPQAPLYRVISNTSNQLLIESTQPLPDLTGRSLIGVMRLDRLVTDAGVRIHAQDRIYADDFDVADAASLEGVAELATDQVIDVDQLVVDGQNALYVANVNAQSVQVSDGSAVFRGQLNIAGALTLRDASVTVSRGLQVGGDAHFSGMLTLRVPSADIAGNATFDGAQATLAMTGEFRARGNLVVTGDSSLSVPYADATAKRYYVADLRADGLLRIDAGSAVDVTGRGLPSSQTIGFRSFSGIRHGSHAGEGGLSYESTGQETSIFGDFRIPSLPGAGGSSAGAWGGGVINLRADTLLLNGALRANAQPVSGGTTGAGGSVMVSVNTLSGSGGIEANGGGTTYVSGAGGRIAIHYQDAAFTGGYTAAGGAGPSDQYPYRQGGAGTVFVRQGNGNGHLIVDSLGRVTTQPTGVRTVGRQTIVGAVLENGADCRISVAGSPWMAPADSIDGLGLRGLWVDLDAGTRDGDLFEVLDNDAASLVIRAPGGACPSTGLELIGVIALDRLTIRGGANFRALDRLVVADADGVETVSADLTIGDLIVGSDSWEGVNWGAGSRLVLTGDQVLGGSLTIDDWSLTVQGGLSIGGNLTLAGDQAALRAERVQVNGDAAISGVGKAPILWVDGVLGAANTADSVHRYPFTVTRSASVLLAVGGIDAPAGFYLYRNGTVAASNRILSAQSGSATTYWLDPGDYVIVVGGGVFNSSEAESGISDEGNISYRLEVRDYADMTSPLHVDSLTVLGNMTLNDATLATREVQVGSDLSLIGRSQIRLADWYDRWLEELSAPLSVHVPSGTLSIGVGSAITVAGQSGLPGGASECYSFGGAHGADSSLSSTSYRAQQRAGYGDFRDPRLAGGCGGYDYRYAGGALAIMAADLINDGVIDASADISSYAAGGSISLDVGTLAGGGDILAQGGNRNYPTSMDVPAGAGGRISVVYGDMSGFAGRVSAAGGLSSRARSYGDAPRLTSTGGAGTVFLRDRQETVGRLIVKNVEARTGQVRPSENYTRLRGVGRHTITAVAPLGGNLLRVEVQGQPWVEPALSVDGLGLIGLWVDLNAANDAGPLYRVQSNGSNYLILEGVTEPEVAEVGNDLIGVIELKRLEISDGARLATVDRLVITDADGLVVADDVKALQVGQLSGWEDRVWPQGMRLHLKGDQAVSNLAVSNYALSVDGRLSIAEGLAVGGANASVSADAISTGDAVLISSGATVATSSLTTTNGANLILVDGGVLTTLPSTQEQYFPLEIDVAGTVSLYGGSRIDVSGKGWWRRINCCNGGGSSAGEGGGSSAPTTYGAYRNARYPGEFGYDTSSDLGGGVIRLRAAALELVDSSVLANGAPNTNTSRRAAGGSIEIAVPRLIGNAASQIAADATGYLYGYGGGGGRVVLDIGLEDGYLGSVSALGGPGSGNQATGAAGTILKRVAGSDGQLLVSNRDPRTNAVIASQRTTPLQAIGRHVISAVAPGSAPDTWLVSLRMPAVLESSTGSVTDSRFRYHRLEVTRRVGLTLAIASQPYQGAFLLFKGSDPSALAPADAVDVTTSTTSRRFVLEPGSYTLAVSATYGRYGWNGNFTAYSIADGQNPYWPGDPIDYTLTMTVDAADMPLSEFGGPAGYLVDLDASTDEGPFYRVLGKQGDNQLLIESAHDLSSAVGRELVGVHLLDEIQVSGQATADFGADRLVVNYPERTVVAADSVLRAGGLDGASFELLASGHKGGRWMLGTPGRLSAIMLDAAELSVEGPLQIDTDLVLAQGGKLAVTGTLQIGGAATLGTGTELTAPSLQAQSLVADNARLQIETLNVTQDLRLRGGSVLTIADPVYSPLRVGSLTVDVGGELEIDLQSRIDLNGKGYPATRSVGGSADRYGCYGGKRSNNPTADQGCIYGRYDRAEYPGSGGTSYYSDQPARGAGGGVGHIKAVELILDGAITANGDSYSAAKGAGGGLHLEADVLRGNGRIEAKGAGGGSSSYPSGGGGRISLAVATGGNLFAGSFDAAGGSYSTTSQIAGAGTVYLTEAGGAGDLTVRNGNRTAQAGSTPMPAVGLAEITAVTQLTATRWEIASGVNNEVHLAGTHRLTGQAGKAILQVPFQLAAARDVELRVRTDFTGSVHLVRLTPSWSRLTYWNTSKGQELSVKTGVLSAGNYVLMIAGGNPSTYYLQWDFDYYSSLDAGDLQYRVDTYGGLWQPSEPAAARGLQGLYVDLDASDVEGPYFKIVSNTDNALVVESAQPLSPSALVGKQLIGVHQLRRLVVGEGASVDFLGDRVIVEDLANSSTGGRVIGQSADSVLPP